LKTGEFEVPVTLNGRTFPLLVDTGGGDTSITGETADDLGLERSWASGGEFLNNIAIDQSVNVSELRIGPLRSNDGWKVLVIPNNIVPSTAAGLLAPDFLDSSDVEFDFYRGKFNLFQHNKCGHVVYWTRDAYATVPIALDRLRHISVQAWLDGKIVTAILDTGSPTSLMSVDAARDLFGWSENDPRVKQTGTERLNGGERAPLYSFPFQSLSFEGIAVLNPRITLIPKKNFLQSRNHDATIVLGMSVLRQLHLYVDYPGKTLYLTGAEAH